MSVLKLTVDLERQIKSCHNFGFNRKDDLILTLLKYII